TDIPTALVLTRQNLTVIDIEQDKLEAGVARGGYIVYQSEQPEILIVATGSEVNLAIDAAKALENQGKGVQVVSMPNTQKFDAQDKAYKEEVLPSSIKQRVAIEMAASDSWYKYVGLNGLVIGIDKFGASAPGELVMEKYGFTVENVVNNILNMK
ncbi:MAG: transketolase C-terminal domain-containing protein, partial [Macrococcus canis]